MKTKLQIEGMSCEHCVKSVKEALEAIAGVEYADVDLKENSAHVEHGDDVDINVLMAAVAESGYKAL